VAQENRIQAEKDLKKYEQLQKQIKDAEEKLKKINQEIKDKN